jgi:hypothetical protein
VSVAEFSELAQQIDTFGTLAYLVTVGSGGSPHSVSVAVSWQGGALVVGAGQRTADNVEHRPLVTLLWPAPPTEPYCLIVDGTARVVAGEEVIAIRPERAVLHRVARADQTVPSCVTLLDR